MAGYSLPKKIQRTIVSILQQNDAERIAIFGSYARGDAGPASDIDILVRFAHPKSLLQIIRIEEDLKAALGMNVDLVTEQAVSPYLADAIHRDEMVIYKTKRSCVSPSYP